MTNCYFMYTFFLRSKLAAITYACSFKHTCHPMYCISHTGTQIPPIPIFSDGPFKHFYYDAFMLAVVTYTRFLCGWTRVCKDAALKIVEMPQSHWNFAQLIGRRTKRDWQLCSVHTRTIYRATNCRNDLVHALVEKLPKHSFENLPSWLGTILHAHLNEVRGSRLKKQPPVAINSLLAANGVFWNHATCERSPKKSIVYLH